MSFSPSAVAGATGAARVAIGTTLLAAPVVSLKTLGVDSASAKRVAFLMRMAAVRDIGLGVGTLAAGRGAQAAPWLAVAAAVDAVDAVVIAGAMRQGATRGIPAAGVALGGAASAAAGLWAAAALRHR